MAVASVHELLDVLARSNLLSRQQITQLRIALSPDEEPRAVLQRLVRSGKLTLWQAQQIYAGHARFYLGKYKLLEFLGQGGMGAVFRAEQSSLHRVVALKLMSREVLNNPVAVSRFLREIRSAGMLDHPNIVRAYDADCVGGQYFLILEYVPGRDLKAWLDQHKRLPVAWACEVARQTALGLQHAHEQGMVHRDIKPANILVVQAAPDARPEVKILDMGLARFISETQEEGEITRSGQIMGTPDYIAPEQARNTREADIRADIFSLGCTLFQLLTGELPFPGTNVMEKLSARLTDVVPRASAFRPELPPAMDDILTKMLARSPDRRFNTPIEVARALAPYALGGAEAPSHDSSLALPALVLGSGVATPNNPSTLDDFLQQLAADSGDTLNSRRPVGWTRSTLMWRTALAGGLLGLIGLGLVILMLFAPRNSTELPPDQRGAQGEPFDEERAAAEHLLTVGATLNLEGAPRQIHNLSELPDGEVTVLGVRVEHLPRFDDQDFQWLLWCPALRSLALVDLNLPPRSLRQLGQITHLTDLDLTDTIQSRDHWAGVGFPPQLRTLILGRISDDGIDWSRLRAIPHLHQLSLTGCRLDNAAWDTLPKLKDLETLSLASTNLEHDQLNRLGNLKSLRHLDLSDNKLARADLKAIGQLTQLEFLRLRNTRLNDQQLRPLHNLTSLRDLNLEGTNVTRAGIDQLQHALPETRIQTDQLR